MWAKEERIKWNWILSCADGDPNTPELQRGSSGYLLKLAARAGSPKCQGRRRGQRGERQLMPQNETKQSRASRVSRLKALRIESK